MANEITHSASLLHRWLRAAWDDGIKTAKGYGDNVHHLEGLQAHRHFGAFLDELRASIDAGSPSVGESGALDVDPLGAERKAKANATDRTNR